MSKRSKTSPPATYRVSPTARAFTLVEMLVVITIIGILVALASVAVFKGLEAAKKARIKAEITNLENALQQYKVAHKDFPPSNLKHTDPAALDAMQRHLANAFPRCNAANEVWFIPWQTGEYPYYDSGANQIKLWDPETNNKRNITGSDFLMTPAQALVFWLTCYSKDPLHPLSAPTEDRQSLFDFDKTRLAKALPNNPDVQIFQPSSPPLQLVGTKCPKFNPAYFVAQSGKSKGYLYFEAKSYPLHAVDSSGVANGLVPYLLEPWDLNNNGLDAGTNGPPTQDVLRDGTNNWVPTSFQKLFANPKSFQIISAGLDGEYGLPSSNQVTARFGGTDYPFKYKSYPGGIGYDTSGADNDNLTNFSEKPLGDAKPD